MNHTLELRTTMLFSYFNVYMCIVKSCTIIVSTIYGSNCYKFCKWKWWEYNRHLGQKSLVSVVWFAKLRSSELLWIYQIYCLCQSFVRINSPRFWFIKGLLTALIKNKHWLYIYSTAKNLTHHGESELMSRPNPGPLSFFSPNLMMGSHKIQ